MLSCVNLAELIEKIATQVGNAEDDAGRSTLGALLAQVWFYYM